MAAVPIADQHVYEVRVCVADDEFDYQYEVDHRFPRLPEVDTLKALKDEATAVFDALYPDCMIDQVSVSCNYLCAEERGGDDDGTERERTAA